MGDDPGTSNHAVHGDGDLSLGKALLSNLPERCRGAVAEVSGRPASDRGRRPGSKLIEVRPADRIHAPSDSEQATRPD